MYSHRVHRYTDRQIIAGEFVPFQLSIAGYSSILTGLEMFGWNTTLNVVWIVALQPFLNLFAEFFPNDSIGIGYFEIIESQYVQNSNRIPLCAFEQMKESFFSFSRKSSFSNSSPHERCTREILLGRLINRNEFSKNANDWINRNRQRKRYVPPVTMVVSNPIRVLIQGIMETPQVQTSRFTLINYDAISDLIERLAA